MHEAYIVAYGRSAIGKGNAKGAYAHSRPDDVAADVLKVSLPVLKVILIPNILKMLSLVVHSQKLCKELTLQEQSP
ncbi:hypothetical protein ACR31S_04090 [Streptococcus iniae]